MNVSELLSKLWRKERKDRESEVERIRIQESDYAGFHYERPHPGAQYVVGVDPATSARPQRWWCGCDVVSGSFANHERHSVGSIASTVYPPRVVTQTCHKTLRTRILTPDGVTERPGTPAAPGPAADGTTEGGK